jgi:hypothetical protein
VTPSRSPREPHLPPRWPLSPHTYPSSCPLHTSTRARHILSLSMQSYPRRDRASVHPGLIVSLMFPLSEHVTIFPYHAPSAPHPSRASVHRVRLSLARSHRFLFVPPFWTCYYISVPRSVRSSSPHPSRASVHRVRLSLARSHRFLFVPPFWTCYYISVPRSVRSSFLTSPTSPNVSSCLSSLSARCVSFSQCVYESSLDNNRFDSNSDNGARRHTGHACALCVIRRRRGGARNDIMTARRHGRPEDNRHGR